MPNALTAIGIFLGITAALCLLFVALIIWLERVGLLAQAIDDGDPVKDDDSVRQALYAQDVNELAHGGVARAVKAARRAGA